MKKLLQVTVKHVYHLFTVYHPLRKKIIKLLDKKKIKTRIIFPYAIQNMKGYRHLFRDAVNLRSHI